MKLGLSGWERHAGGGTWRWRHTPLQRSAIRTDKAVHRIHLFVDGGDGDTQTRRGASQSNTSRGNHPVPHSAATTEPACCDRCSQKEPQMFVPVINRMQGGGGRGRLSVTYPAVVGSLAHRAHRDQLRSVGSDLHHKAGWWPKSCPGAGVVPVAVSALRSDVGRLDGYRAHQLPERGDANTTPPSCRKCKQASSASSGRACWSRPKATMFDLTQA